jgi:hypothetical protein
MITPAWERSTHWRHLPDGLATFVLSRVLRAAPRAARSSWQSRCPTGKLAYASDQIVIDQDFVDAANELDVRSNGSASPAAAWKPGAVSGPLTDAVSSIVC